MKKNRQRHSVVRDIGRLRIRVSVGSVTSYCAQHVVSASAWLINERRGHASESGQYAL